MDESHDMTQPICKGAKRRSRRAVKSIALRVAEAEQLLRKQQLRLSADRELEALQAV